MKTRMKTALAVATILLLASGSGAALVKRASAAESADASLFLPASYEQYLPLTAPADAAVNDDYVVIADGEYLYVYDRENASYGCYTHGRNITKVQFSPDGRLFFSDQAMQLYLFDAATKEAALQSVPCTTFVIDGDTLYTAAVTNSVTTFYALSHRNNDLTLEGVPEIGHVEMPTSIAPHMFVKDGVLYCAINSHVHAYTYSNGSYVHTELLLAGSTSVQYLTSVAVFGDEIYYTVNGSVPTDGLYTTELNAPSSAVVLGGGFRALSVYGDKLYCVKGATVRELAAGEDGALAYTGFEIAAASDSLNRLSDAGDTVRAKDLVVTADRGNARVSVYDRSGGTFTVIDSGTPNCVATDGTVIAVGVGNTVKVYDYPKFLEQEEKRKNDPEAPAYQPYEQTTENVVLGVAVVYGRTYYITEHHYGVAEKDGIKEFTRSNSPLALTADVYGNLYVADQQYAVRKYTETEFLDFLSEGTLVTEGWQLPQDFKSLRADFDGGLYYLSGASLYCGKEEIAAFSAEGVVYYGMNAVPLPPVSFALGFEDGGLYVQYGSFILYTEGVAIPSLSTIGAEGVYGEVYGAPEEQTVSFADVVPGATGIGVDASKLGEFEPYFSYRGYARAEQGGRGVVLAEKGKFLLLALFEDHAYTIGLYRAEDCEKHEAVREEVSPSARYLSSEVALSRFPCLEDSLTVQRLPRSAAVTLLATVSAGEGLGFDFAFVRAGNGYGYVPLAYLTENVPFPDDPDEYFLGYLKAQEEGVLFRADNGQTLRVTERTQVKIYDAGDGLYLCRLSKDGVEYGAQVTRNMIETGNPTVLRMSVIIILCVLAVGVVAAYVLLVPRKKRK